MRILLTNDDGIYAPGLRALRTELQKLGTVLGRRPGDRAERRGPLGHAPEPAARQRGVRGRRQDARRLGGRGPARGLRQARAPGTAARPAGRHRQRAERRAATRASTSSTPAPSPRPSRGRSIAAPRSPSRWSTTRRSTTSRRPRGTPGRWSSRSWRRSRPTGACSTSTSRCSSAGRSRACKVLPQNVSPYTEKFDRRVNPRGRTYFWASPEFLCPDPHPDTDVEALADSYITVTPLKFDLTDHARLAELQKREWKLG